MIEHENILQKKYVQQQKKKQNITSETNKNEKICFFLTKKIHYNES